MNDSKRFFLITGPPAVGKMSVGQALAERLDFRLFHNHHSIEFALQFFPYGSVGFAQVNEGMRELVFEAAAESDELKGFIFTFVWAFDRQQDWDRVEALQQQFVREGWVFYFVELYSPLEIRLQRNDTPNRLAEKPSKREVAASRERMIRLEKNAQLNSRPGQILEPNYVRIDNARLSPAAVVDRIMAHFGLSLS